MKNTKKKLITLVTGLAVLASSATPMGASAATNVTWSDAEYIPYTGKFYADSTRALVKDMRWSASQVDGFKDFTGLYCVEFEFRPVNSPYNIWTGITSKSSNLPDVYYEFDVDDVTFRCGNIKKIVAETRYNATMMLGKQSGFNDSLHPYTFEAEYGIGISTGLDYQPLRYATYGDWTNNVQFGQTYSW